MQDLNAGNALFFDALVADGPDLAFAPKMTLYDRVLGDWELEVIDHGADGSRRVSTGEVHFVWVLEGRAIQDVWIVPARGERNPDLPSRGNRYGTTLRVYDPTEDVWRVTWFNPVNGTVSRLVARQVGDDIVQEGEGADGSGIRWSFTRITPTSFHWVGEVSRDGGESWQVQSEFIGRR